jgi:Arc/MetJ family transcription regulator
VPGRAPLGSGRGHRHNGIYVTEVVYTGGVAKHLVDLDEEALSRAQAELGTTTIKDTVNLALERATSSRHRRVVAALDVLARTDLEDRSEAWR